jgi:hypothetical protein
MFLRLAAVAFLPLTLALPSFAQQGAVAMNMALVGHNDLNGNGDGGEGMAIQLLPGGRRIVYLAHEGQKTCVSVIDVTRPENPVMINQLPSPAPGITRCNSLAVSGNVLAIANQTLEVNQKTAGVWLLDISNIDRVQKATKLDDLKFSFFDTSGRFSRGVHCIWFVDGEFMHVTTGSADFEPTNPLDDQFYMIVDVRDPKNPHEVGRWWYPGTRKGDSCLPGCLPPRQKPFDSGYRPHQIEVWPDHADRAYMAYIEGGAFIMDISGLADVKAGRAKSFTPKVIGHINTAPPYLGFTHTLQPNFDRGYAFMSDEENLESCKDMPKTVWLVDIRIEANPMTIASAPFHADDAELCKKAGRFGPHNLSPNFPGPASRRLKNNIVASWFGGGVRIFHIVNGPAGIPGLPPHLEEIGHYTPAPLPKNPGGAPQMNHAIVDENGLIYTNDRVSGGLYILRYTGQAPLD